MEITNTCEKLNVRNSDLTDSQFASSQLIKTRFEDVSLQESTFTNADLGNTRFFDVNLAGEVIQDANLTGMAINGMLVTDLIRAFENRAQMVLYAKNLVSMQAFYQGVFLLTVETAAADHVVLASPACQLILVEVPAAIASTIHIADPPARRSETPFKLVLEVESIAAARNAALGWGGRVDPVEREWTFQGRRVCDGHDPEGNVVQFRQWGGTARS